MEINGRNLFTYFILPKLEEFWICGVLFQLDSESMIAGKAAIGNMLGGIGYFYGQSKISLPGNPNVSNMNLFDFLYVK